MLLAFQIAKELGKKITSVFLESLDHTLNGALNEQEFLRNQGRLSTQDYYKTITLKSASFFGATCKIGSIIASAPPDLTKIMGNYDQLLEGAINLPTILSTLRLEMLGDLLDHSWRKRWKKTPPRLKSWPIAWKYQITSTLRF